MRLCLLRETIAARLGRGRDRAGPPGPGQLPDPPVRHARPRSTGGSPVWSRGTTVAAFALTEPEAGSDAAALALRAEPDGDGWRLHGEKIWISNAPEADVYTVFARTTQGAGARGVTAFAVAGDADGLSGEHLDLLAPHPIGRLRFDGVRVEPRRRARRGRRGLPGRDAHPRSVPPQRRRVRRRDGAGGDRRDARPCVARARGVRRSARRPAGRPAHARRPGDAGPRPPGCWCTPRRAPTTPAPPAREITTLRGDGQAVRHRGRPDGRRPVRPAARRSRAASAATCWSASIATCAPPRIYEGASEVQRSIIARELFKERSAQ